MEDLTKPFKFKNKAKQLEFDIPNMPKAGFIASRMNKDNFWNLMFLILPSIPVFIAQEVMDFIPGGAFLLLAILILSPYLVSKANKVEYRDDMFRSTSTNRILCPYMPEAVGFILWLAIPFTTLWVLYIKYPLLNKNLAVYNLVFWFVPTMYFILKNLPISIIFNKTAWTKGDRNNQLYSSPNNHWNNNLFKANHFTHPNNYYRDIRNSFSKGNIYHRK
jgi:hypothetical protein